MAKRRSSSPGHGGAGQGVPPAGVAPSDTSASAYTDALAAFSAGLEALGANRLDEAERAFGAVLERWGDERELAERSRTYLAVCGRRRQAAAPEDGSVAERLLAATMATNAGDTDRALRLLERLLADAPATDQAHYMLAVVHADKGRLEAAAAALARAVELNPENRKLARRDPDLRGLRDHPAASALLGRPGT
jgi:tetratricopeptide (TPR) repeat protein